jgi:hypothetical protein
VSIALIALPERLTTKAEKNLPHFDVTNPDSTDATIHENCRLLSSLQQKNSKFMSCPAMAAPLREGVTAMMAAQGRAS